eukprot:TRINITY_DN2070_c0_g1::TRINITY_DN2070_c0_g1_i1::g.21848::m.21848 TRINITY_DN2070_c0_g1::TRINITY_DN2070_c0_g1_i1::g.21848  ORF type:complete len:851 (+),score=246.46,sp/P00690/AMYP_PIG/31.71/8e-38,Alpha-amylase/PF00128.19/1.1e-15,EGF_2/PF07974.8/6.2e-05,EGF_2/PF07974.8/2,EGF_2/PF07974.8/1.5e+04,EGF_2/PF07974.8/1.5e+04,DSL/PF01414.14/6.9e+02,DSL/PF01414.14/0.21,DSL/PF01414.14/1.9e+03 TRINITY_DN2070_c0_g1_i1:67-2553(+)
MWNKNLGCKPSLLGIWLLLLAAFATALPVNFQPSSALPDPGAGVVTIYYKSTWNPPYLHYNSGNGWTVVPGAKMLASTNTSYPSQDGWWMYGVQANQLTFLPNNGAGSWEHSPSGGDYFASTPGIYSLSGGKLVLVQGFPKNCPGTPLCTGNGVCESGECKCHSGYYGPDCSKACGCGVNQSCDSTGKCICSKPYYGTKCELYCDPDQFSWCDGQCIKDSACPPPSLPGEETYTDGRCSGDQTSLPAEFENRRWQTPPSDSLAWYPGYADYSHLVGHAHVAYDSSRTSATVDVKVVLKSNDMQLTYYFDGQAQSTSSKKFDKTFTRPLDISVVASNGKKLVLDAVDFIWNTHTPISHTAGDYRDGQKGAIVEMFGWPDEDIDAECAHVGQLGYMGVKLFPHHEQLMAGDPYENVMNPWYFMYQPVSYRLQGRAGTRDDLRRLIATCRKNKVRVYADAVLNHMTGGGNDANIYHRDGKGNYWGNKTSSAYLSQTSSPFYNAPYTFRPNAYTNQPPAQEYPGVPYGPTDFHCEKGLSSWSDPNSLNYGWLVGLTDIATEKASVQDRIADYLTDLLGIGFSGFRIDAAKHIRPDDIVAILTKFKLNLGGSLTPDFFTWLEVLHGGEGDLLLCNEGDYNYGPSLVDKLKKAGWTDAEVNQVKLWSSWYPNEPDRDCGKISKHRQVIQNDDHDQQQSGSTSRDMHDKGSVLVKDKDVAKHRSFEVRLFDSPYGASDNKNDYPIRMVLSSFYYGQSTPGTALEADGIPDGLSTCAVCSGSDFCKTCEDVPYVPAYKAESAGYDSGFYSYTRVHRDAQIVAAMRKWMGLSTAEEN